MSGGGLGGRAGGAAVAGAGADTTQAGQRGLITKPWLRGPVRPGRESARGAGCAGAAGSSEKGGEAVAVRPMTSGCQRIDSHLLIR